jgi:hypothetical protein
LIEESGVFRPGNSLFIPSLLITLSISCFQFSGRPFAAAPMAPTPQASAALDFKPLSDKSVVYLYRHWSMPQRRAFLYVDKIKIGYTVFNSFVRLELSPGRHEIYILLENFDSTDIGATPEQGDDSIIDFLAEPGQLYFIKQYPSRASWSGKLNLQMVPTDEGRKAVMLVKNKLIDIR